MSALPPKADIRRQLADVRFGPKADSCAAPKLQFIRSPRRRGQAAELGWWDAAGLTARTTSN